MSNSIMVLKPYYHNGMWVFDDETTGLVREPFVAGVPEILEMMLQAENIPLDQARNGFKLIFAATPFPGYQLEAKWVAKEYEGNWYEAQGRRGWLCPALFSYFDHAPPNLYVKVEPI